MIQGPSCIHPRQEIGFVGARRFALSMGRFGERRVGEAMTRDKTIQIRISNAAAKKISVLANQEGRKVSEMARILLEDALALRETIKSQSDRIEPNRPR